MFSIKNIFKSKNNIDILTISVMNLISSDNDIIRCVIKTFNIELSTDEHYDRNNVYCKEIDPLIVFIKKKKSKFILFIGFNEDIREIDVTHFINAMNNRSIRISSDFYYELKHHILYNLNNDYYDNISGEMILCSDSEYECKIISRLLRTGNI